jgi:hypothetical protein
LVEAPAQSPLEEYRACINEFFIQIWARIGARAVISSADHRLFCGSSALLRIIGRINQDRSTGPIPCTGMSASSPAPVTANKRRAAMTTMTQDRDTLPET